VEGPGALGKADQLAGVLPAPGFNIMVNSDAFQSGCCTISMQQQ